MFQENTSLKLNLKGCLKFSVHLHFQSLTICELLTLNVVEVNLPAESPTILVLKSDNDERPNTPFENVSLDLRR